MYKIKVCIFCDNKYQPTTGRQSYCNNCISKGIARKQSLKKYDSSDKAKKNRNKQYYKDIKHTREIKNRYNRSEKAKLVKRRYFLKNKTKIYDKLKKRKKELYSRIKAKSIVKKLGWIKECKDCGTKNYITLHHIDGNCFNNNIDNLVYLCRRCHGDRHILMNLNSFVTPELY